MPRIGIIGLQHESNTFLPEPTEVAHFQAGVFLRGEAIRHEYESAHHEVGGFFEGLAVADFEAVPLFFAFAMPTGAITAQAAEKLWSIALDELRQAGPLDGILAHPHGAAVGEGETDFDGWWLTQLRREVGPEIPVMAVIDPHANLTKTMVDAVDALIAYRENPHIDQRQRGREAADLMVRTLRGEIRPVTAASFLPLAINIERQHTGAEPMLSVAGELDRIRQLEGILSVSLIMGYPYADVPEMGCALAVVADQDRALARETAQALGHWLWTRREEFRGQLLSPEDAFLQAREIAGPVGLLDMGDNIGGGSTADSTVLAALCLAQPGLRAFVCLLDPESVLAAERLGVGGRGVLRMGGKAQATPAPPLEAEVEVTLLQDGIYEEAQPRHGGNTHFDMGRIAVVRTLGGLTIMLTSRRAFPASANQMLSFGLKPSAFDVLILKGVQSPIAAYQEHCAALIRVNTPGVTTADMNQLSYSRRRRPLFPFETDFPDLSL